MADTPSADNPAGESLFRDVVLITDQRDVIDVLVADDGAYSISNELTVDGALKRDAVHGAAGVVIYDVDTVGGDSRRAVEDLERIHRDDPSKVIILIGPQEPLNAILTTRARALAYRAFNKPINRSQMKLCLGSAQALHHDLVQKRARGENIFRIDSDATADTGRSGRRTGPLLAGLAALVVMAPLAYFLLGPTGGAPTASDPGSDAEERGEAETAAAQTELRSRRVAALLLQAEVALTADRLILPEGDSALHYFNETLRIDPYNADARDGKQALSTTLLTRFRQRLEQKQFDEAMDLAFDISRLDPRNRRYQSLQAELQTAMSRHLERLQAANAPAARVSDAAATLEQVQLELAASSAALQREADALDAVQAALDREALIPPAADNAFDLIAEATRDAAAGEDALLPLKAELSRRLLERATAEVDADRLDRAGDYAKFANSLAVDAPGLAELEQRIVARLSASAAARPSDARTSTEAIAAGGADPTAKQSETATAPAAERDEAGESEGASRQQVARIVPARILKRVPPDYPRRALQRRIEGWVDVSFTIDTDGKAVDIAIVDSEPARLFDRFALRAVQQWEFEPARDESSGTAFASRIDSFRVSFQVE